MEKRRKTYEELRFTDDFMFCNILVDNLDLCKELLELILDIKIKNIKLAQEQKTIQSTYEGKGVRLDVFVEDDGDTVYDIEMQTVTRKDLPKRTRYYQGMLDSKLINRGEEYTKLKKSYIIFICMDVFFDGNLPIYTFENICTQDKSIKLNDEAVKVIINASGDRQNISSKMCAFLDYIKDSVVNDDFTSRLEDKVKESKSIEEWRDTYMTLEMKIMEERAEAREEGKAESLKNVIRNMLNRGMTKEEIMSICGVEMEMIEELCQSEKK